MRDMKIQIMGISECRWMSAGQVVLSTSERILYSGRSDDKHFHGVAIMMDSVVKRALMEWTPISEGIIKARFYSKLIKLTVIHAYAPTNDAEEEEKDKFHDQLGEVISQVKRHDMLVLTGDMNAKVGNNPSGLERVMGEHELGSIRSDNGERLIESWVSPDGKTVNEIHHTLINTKFRTSVMDTKASRSADIGSDHYLVRTTIKLKLCKVDNKENIRSKFDLQQFMDVDVSKRFRIQLRNKFQLLTSEAERDCKNKDDPEERLELKSVVLEKAYVKTAEEVTERREGNPG